MKKKYIAEVKKGMIVEGSLDLIKKLTIGFKGAKIIGMDAI